MRIVAGEFRGRVLAAPASRLTRPTADRVREALFDILTHGEWAPEGECVLDAFAGSGALGFEALSRGAAQVTFIESEEEPWRVIASNIKKLGVEKRTRLLRADALRPPKADKPCRLVLLDPPYAKSLAPPAIAALAKAGWIAADALVVAEVAAGEKLDPPPEGFAVRDDRRYGAARLVFLEGIG